jgi:hypothetical protein
MRSDLRQLLCGVRRRCVTFCSRGYARAWQRCQAWRAARSVDRSLSFGVAHQGPAAPGEPERHSSGIPVERRAADHVGGVKEAQYGADNQASPV